MLRSGNMFMLNEYGLVWYHATTSLKGQTVECRGKEISKLHGGPHTVTAIDTECLLVYLPFTNVSEFLHTLNVQTFFGNPLYFVLDPFTHMNKGLPLTNMTENSCPPRRDQTVCEREIMREVSRSDAILEVQSVASANFLLRERTAGGSSKGCGSESDHPRIHN